MHVLKFGRAVRVSWYELLAREAARAILSSLGKDWTCSSDAIRTSP